LICILLSVECVSPFLTNIVGFPRFIDCSAKVLTAPLNGTFLHYCFVSSYPGNGDIQFSWKRHNGQLDPNRTLINSSGTDYLKNVSILIYNVQEHDEDTYILTVQNHCGARNSSTYVAVNQYGGKLGGQFVYLGTNKVPAFCYLGDWAY